MIESTVALVRTLIKFPKQDEHIFSQVYDEGAIPTTKKIYQQQ